MKNKLYQRGLALFLMICVSCASCSGGMSAASMHLRRTEGTVGVSDGEGKDLEPKENLGLYSGYGVGTQSASYAWIDLDEVKLTKLDENGQIEITKENKRLEIEVKSGALFFNVTEPLAEDEVMNIRSSSMLVGIRGTCGWVEVPDPEHMILCLLEGTVECTAGPVTTTVDAGKMAVMTAGTAGNDIALSELSAADIPAFVLEEIEGDGELTAQIKEESGIDPTASPPAAPEPVRATTYTADGTPTERREYRYNDQGLQNIDRGYFYEGGAWVLNSENQTDYDDRGVRTETRYYTAGDSTLLHLYSTERLEEEGENYRVYRLRMADSGVLRTESTFYLDDEGKPAKMETTQYDEAGNFFATSTQQYNSEGSAEISSTFSDGHTMDNSMIYEYDSQGNVIRFNQYDQNGVLYSYTVYEYGS